MSFRLGIPAFSLLVFSTGWAGQATETAPLGSTKKELEALSRQPSSSEATTGSSELRLGLPQVQGPLIDAARLGLPETQKRDSSSVQKKDRKKNWLLDGVNKLEKEAAVKATGKDDEKVESEEHKEDELNPNDADYLLQAYARQQEKNEEKPAVAARPTPGRADPMAPFLQNWLADSPVRGKFFDDYSNQRGASAREGVEPAPGLPRESTIQSFGAVDASVRERSVAVHESTPPNPYLQETPAARSLPAGETLNLPALFQSGMSEQGSSSWREPAGAISPPIEPVRKPQFSVQPDEQKYFPQLKKF